MTGSDTDADDNLYELQRRERIKYNNKILQQLGVDKVLLPMRDLNAAAKTPRATRPDANRPVKRHHPFADSGDDQEQLDVKTVRKSTRLAPQEQPRTHLQAPPTAPVRSTHTSSNEQPNTSPFQCPPTTGTGKQPYTATCRWNEDWSEEQTILAVCAEETAPPTSPVSATHNTTTVASPAMMHKWQDTWGLTCSIEDCPSPPASRASARCWDKSTSTKLRSDDHPTEDGQYPLHWKQGPLLEPNLSLPEEPSVSILPLFNHACPYLGLRSVSPAARHPLRLCIFGNRSGAGHIVCELHEPTRCCPRARL